MKATSLLNMFQSYLQLNNTFYDRNTLSTVNWYISSISVCWKINWWSLRPPAYYPKEPNQVFMWPFLSLSHRIYFLIIHTSKFPTISVITNLPAYLFTLNVSIKRTTHSANCLPKHRLHSVTSPPAHPLTYSTPCLSTHFTYPTHSTCFSIYIATH
jgi:hypothetical protein